MPLKKVLGAENQRVTSGDWNNFGIFGLGNLSLAIKAFVGGHDNDFVVYGGKVKPTSPASADILVEPIAAIDDSNNLVISESEETLSIAANASGNPRIDLVVVSFQETSEPQPSGESRLFWNPGTETAFSQDTFTRKEAVALFEVVQGTPAGSPSPPSTPAGAIAIATILVPNGFSTIVAGDITQIETIRRNPLRLNVWQGPGAAPQGLPWDSGDLLSLETPSGRITLLLSQIFLRTNSSPIDLGYRHAIRNTTDGADVGFSHSISDPATASLTVQPFASIAMAVIVGPSAAVKSYAVRIYPVKITGKTSQTSVIVPSSYADVDLGTVQLYNYFAAVTL